VTAGRGGAVLSQRARCAPTDQDLYGERGNQAYPLSELQAAVLAPQLEKLAERNRCRRENVARLLEHCRDVAGLRPLQTTAGSGEASFYKLPWLFAPPQVDRHPRDEFVAAMRAEGVALDAGFRGFTQTDQTPAAGRGRTRSQPVRRGSNSRATPSRPAGTVASHDADRDRNTQGPLAL